MRVLKILSTPCPVPKRRVIITWFFPQSAEVTPYNHGKENKKSNLFGSTDTTSAWMLKSLDSACYWLKKAATLSDTREVVEE